MYNLILPALIKTVGHHGDVLTISEAFENKETTLRYDHHSRTMTPLALLEGEIALDDKSTNRLYEIRFKNGQACELLFGNQLLLSTGEWATVSSIQEDMALKALIYDNKSKHLEETIQTVVGTPQAKRVDFLPTFLCAEGSEDGFLICSDPTDPRFLTILFAK